MKHPKERAGLASGLCVVDFLVLLVFRVRLGIGASFPSETMLRADFSLRASARKVCLKLIRVSECPKAVNRRRCGAREDKNKEHPRGQRNSNFRGFSYCLKLSFIYY